jgi:FtsP/CotA-like multicopper oxidase with cupredoxin domain
MPVQIGKISVEETAFPGTKMGYTFGPTQPRGGVMYSQSILRRILAGLFLLLCLMHFAAAQAGQPIFVNPPNINYNGATVDLTGTKATITWAGFTNVVTNVYTATYAGKTYPPSYAPPTLRVNPGSTLQLNLTNALDNTLYQCFQPHEQPYTNLHYHGTEVSPLSPGDDVFITVLSGNSFLYKVPVPTGHPDGMFWYHPHPHGCSFGQVNNGMSGALIIGDLLADQFPLLAGTPEKVLLVKDGNPSPNLPFTITVNGLKNPLMNIDENTLQFFRIANVGTDTFYNIAICPVAGCSNLVRAWIIAVDGFVLNQPILLDNNTGWLLAPAARVEMVVDGPPPGTYLIQSNFLGSNVTLATLVSTANATAQQATAAQLNSLQQPPANRAALYPSDQDFVGATGDSCTYFTQQVPGCTFNFTESNGSFFINGHLYDANHLDVSCPLGSKNNWTLCNQTPEDHAFHLHQIHFRVNDIDGKAIQAPIRDTVDMPHQIDSKTPSKVHLTAAFINPIILGEFVLHCHILAHEDLGMMQNIQICRKEDLNCPPPLPPAASIVTRPSHKMDGMVKPGNR